MTVSANHSIHAQPLTLNVPISGDEPIGCTLEVFNRFALLPKLLRLAKNPRFHFEKTRVRRSPRVWKE